jgi:iron complex outermembrane recepter protein
MASRNKLLALAVTLVAVVGVSGRALAQDQQPTTAQPAAPGANPAETATPPPAVPDVPVPTPAPAEQPATIAPSDQPGETVTAGKGGKNFTEEIVVTGSRIRRKDLTTPAPVAVLNREQIQASGRVSLGEFLQTLPEQGNALNTAVNNGGSGATRVDLRGLGNQRTLVLINGRRMVGVGTGLDSGTGADLNAIPIAAVERIEVLKDGASAVYGSDAIAGVVNVITKRAYSGVEATAYSGLSSHGDGFTNDLNVTAGSTGDIGSFMFSAGFYDQQKVGAFDREWSKFQLDYDYTTGQVTRIGSSRVPGGRIIGRGGAAGNSTWQGVLANNPGGSFTYDKTLPGCTPTGDQTACWRNFNANAVAGTAGGGDLYNFQPPNYDVTPGRRLSLFSSGEAKLSDAVPVKAFFEGTYTNRNSSYALAEEPLIIGTGGLDVTVSAQNGYNPFGRDFTQVTRRLVEFGPRQQSQAVDTFRVVGGLNGLLPFGWTWETSLNYGRTDWTDVNRGNIFKSRLQNAVGPTYVDKSGVLQCGTAPLSDGSVPIPGCVPLDLFHGAGSMTPAMAGYLSFSGVSRIANQLTSAQVNTAGELPVSLLASRPVGLALGYEYRFEQGVDTPDSLTALGESSGNNRQATGGHFWSNEGYGELSVPIADHMPLVENLEATAALRIVDYNTFGTNTSYKFGARYSPIRDITFRGTYSTAFRAPNITELFLGASDNFPSVQDPCANLAGATPALQAACAAAGVPAGGTGSTETQLRTKNGGNPNLKPETAKTWTVGTVIEPQMVKGLSFTVDYYWIEIKDAISTAGAGFILSQCYPNAGQPNPAYCALVHRDATGNVTNIDDLNLNVGGTNTAGVDFSARYQMPTPGFGRFGFGFDGTWMQYYNVTQPGGKVLNMKGNFDQGVLLGGLQGVYPAFKGLASAVWGLGGLGAGASVKYTGKIRQCSDSSGTTSGTCFDNTTGLSRDVGDYATMDAFVGYNFKTPAGTTSFTVGVNNVFDAAPRTIYGALEPNSDPTAYDFMGRFFYVRLGQRI